MPIYEYDCQACGGGFELLIRGSESAVCPECGSEKLEKRFSVFGVVTGRGGPACTTGELPSPAG